MMINKKQPLKTELYQRFIVHWKSTLAGLAIGCGDFFIDVAHALHDQILTFVDPSTLDWPTLRARIIKSLIISTVIALGRFNWHRDPNHAQRREYDPQPDPPKDDQK